MILPLRSDTAAADGDPGNVGLERRHGKPEAIVSGSEACGVQMDPERPEALAPSQVGGGQGNVSAIESLSAKRTSLNRARALEGWRNSGINGSANPMLPKPAESFSGTRQAVSDLYRKDSIAETCLLGSALGCRSVS